MAKEDGKTNKVGKNGKLGGVVKSDKDKNGKDKPSRGKGDKRIDWTLNLAEDRIESIESSTTVSERLARAAKSSELLSAVWSLPPAQRLMFHPGTQVTDVEGDSTPGFDGGKEDAERFISISSSEIARYQRLMYANGVKGSPRRLLIVLQGMDASGKGGIVRHVFSQGDPMGIHYHGFGKPGAEELDHDFLWRVKRELPKRGWIAVFDRSHYEDVVMPHVYGTYPEDVWRARYDQINEFERELADVRFSRSFSWSARMSRKSIFSAVLMIPPNIGSSISPTLKPAIDGTTTWTPGRRFLKRPALPPHRGIWCRLTTGGIHAPWFPSCCAPR